MKGEVVYNDKHYSWVGIQFLVKEYPIKEVWRINANNHKALLEIEQQEGRQCKGRLIFDELGENENLEKIFYGTENGMIQFVRNKGSQIFEATVMDNKMRGIFISDKRKYSWEGFRIDNCNTQINKEWRINVGGHLAKLNLSANEFKSSGTIRFDQLNKVEILDEIHFNPLNERIYFKRKLQVFDGSSVNDKLSGSFYLPQKYQHQEYDWRQVDSEEDEEESQENQSQKSSKKRRVCTEEGN